jgi:hypothetical protein
VSLTSPGIGIYLPPLVYSMIRAFGNIGANASGPIDFPVPGFKGQCVLFVIPAIILYHFQGFIFQITGIFYSVRLPSVIK